MITPLGSGFRVTGCGVGGGDGVLDGGAVSAGAEGDGANGSGELVAVAAVLVVAVLEAAMRDAAVLEAGAPAAEAGGASPIRPMALKSRATRAATDAKDTSPIDPRGRTGGDTSLRNPRIPPHSRG
ncbi:hypothetical protein ACRAWB_07670 [Leifsonia poae]|uniref:hypothetical protein n=1 Tax=Leifsonia poae TaxID=110933 RepID=UPI003D6864A7